MHIANYEDDSACLAFAKLLSGSPRILCGVGAGLSASSGLATWRGTNGLWNDVKLKDLALPKSFQEDPATVWRFYDMSDLPRCPICGNLLRPGVVWFGERLAAGAPDNIDNWVVETDVDLVIAAGTSLEVFPAAEWVGMAREYGAALAIFDLDRHNLSVNEWDDDD